MPGVDRIRRSLKLAAAVSGAAAFAAACAPGGQPPVFAVKQANPLVTEVVASANDAGRASSVAIGPDGAPFVSYLLLTPTLTKDQVAPVVVPNTPQPPAVVVATFDSAKGFWTRMSASPQDYAKAKGTEASIADKSGKFLAGVNTAIAVDAQGKQHVVWATPSGLFYTDNTASAAFADPEQVTKTAARGASIAVDKTGAPWISYYDGDTVTVATKANGNWTTQVVSLTTSCASCPPVRTEIALAPGSGAITVAFTDGGGATPVVAASQPPAGGAVPSSWSVTRFATSTGGFGISLALSKDGTAAVAYYGADGRVYLGTGLGSGDAPSPKVISSATAATGADSSGWTTGVGVDDSGKVAVTWVDPAANQVVLGTGAGPNPDALRTVTVPQSLGGRQPALGVSPDGKSLVLAFYDVTNHQLAVALPVVGGIALGVPSPTPSPPPTPPTGPACSPTDSTQLSITAKGTAFSTNCLAVIPKTAFSVAFDNQDAGTPHNWDLYKDAGYTQHLAGATATETFPGVATQTYQIDPLAEGVYFFKCDVHPNMTGQLVVTGPQPGPSASP